MKLNRVTQGFSFPIFCAQCNYLIRRIYDRKLFKTEILVKMELLFWADT
jgi:hypothetical protein